MSDMTINGSSSSDTMGIDRVQLSTVEDLASILHPWPDAGDDENHDEVLVDADLDRVDGVRAGVDAILVGSNTVRRDDPRLLVRSPARRQARAARGTTATPAKVTVSGRGDLDPAARFFVAADVEKIVYVGSNASVAARERLGEVATVVDAGDPVELRRVLADLGSRGVRRLLVEGGGATHTQFLTAGLADELRATG